jgi:hypothetical protein
MPTGNNWTQKNKKKRGIVFGFFKVFERSGGAKYKRTPYLTLLRGFRPPHILCGNTMPLNTSPGGVKVMRSNLNMRMKTQHIIV